MIKSNEIPKKIFYVWGYGESKKESVEKCIETWRINCPNYEIIELNEENTDYFNYELHINTNKWFKTVYEKKMWAYVADYIRISVLYYHGGIYLDTDVSVLKNFDCFLNEPAFVGMQSKFLVETAILGSKKKNSFLKLILQFYIDEIWKQPIYYTNQIFMHYLQKNNDLNIYPFPDKNSQNILKLNDITIYPEAYFIPFRYKQKFSNDCITNFTHTIHWWNASWVKPEITRWLKTKHINQVDFTVNNKIIDLLVQNNNNLNDIKNLFNVCNNLEIYRTLKCKLSTNKPILPIKRIGSSNDGGYVLADDFSQCKKMLSFGIGNNVSLDLEFANKDIAVYQFDPTVEKSPIDHNNFHFFNLGVTGPKHIYPLNPKYKYKNLSDLIFYIDDDSNAILKMDVEGYEYDALLDDNVDFSNFQHIIVEFHFLLNPMFANLLNVVLDKINNTHQVIHVHANNWGEMTCCHGNVFASVIEVTFLRKSDHKFDNINKIPLSDLDNSNKKDKFEYILF